MPGAEAQVPWPGGPETWRDLKRAAPADERTSGEGEVSRERRRPPHTAERPHAGKRKNGLEDVRSPNMGQGWRAPNGEWGWRRVAPLRVTDKSQCKSHEQNYELHL